MRQKKSKASKAKRDSNAFLRAVTGTRKPSKAKPADSAWLIREARIKAIENALASHSSCLEQIESRVIELQETIIWLTAREDQRSNAAIRAAASVGGSFEVAQKGSQIRDPDPSLCTPTGLTHAVRIDDNGVHVLSDHE